MKTRFLSAALAAMLIPAAASAQVLVGDSLSTSEETAFPAQANLPGLFQAKFTTGRSDKTSDIMSSSTLAHVPGPIMANTVGSAMDLDGKTWDWGDNMVFGYLGEMHVEAGTTYTFGKSVDDWTYIVVDGKTIIENGTWDSFQTGTYTARRTGWVPIEIRIGNSDGGYGLSKGAKWGIAFNTVGDTSWDHFKVGTFGWQALLDPGDGSLLRTGFYKGIRIISRVRDNDPTILDVRYIIYGEENEVVNVRALAFEDGERSFLKVVRPETWVEGTEANIGDGIAANVAHRLSWRVSSDWKTDLAKVKFEVLAMQPGDLLMPMHFVTIPATDAYPALKVSVNKLNQQDVFNALLWLYADKDPEMTLVDGTLMTDLTFEGGNIYNGKTWLASERHESDFSGIVYAEGCSKEICNNWWYGHTCYSLNAPAYVLRKLGYSFLPRNAEITKHVESVRRIVFERDNASVDRFTCEGLLQYAVKTIEE